MIRTIATKAAFAVVVLFIMTFLTFFLASLIPGNAATTILGQDATPERIAELNSALGFDQPLFAQYLDWITSALRGDLGSSLYTGESTLSVLQQRFWPTFWLATIGAAVSGVIGVAFGMFAAVRGGRASRVLDLVGILGISLPNFWIALLLISIVAGNLGLLPALGYNSPSDDLGGWASHLVLPVTTLALGGIALVAKQTRDAYGDALSRDFMRFLQANGFPTRALLFTHGLRYASVPIVSAISITFINMFGSTAAIESVFAIPGYGSIVTTATLNHDLALVQGVVLAYTVVIVIATVFSDVIYALLNPKIGTR